MHFLKQPCHFNSLLQVFELLYCDSHQSALCEQVNYERRRIEEELKHYDRLPNMLFVLHVLLKQRRPRHGFNKTPEVSCDIWHQDVAADPSSPLGCEVDSPWTELVGPEHPTDGLDLDLGNLEVQYLGNLGNL